MKSFIRILAGIVGVLAVLAALLIVRTLTIAPFAPAPRSAPAYGTVDAGSIAKHLGEAIRFRTISYEPGTAPADANTPFVEFRAWIDATYPAFRAAASREMVGNAMLYTWKGSRADLQPVLLMSHMDVVPVMPGSESRWKHPPFAGDIADGYVWGRGAIDCKGSLIAILEAADALAAGGFRPSRTIYFAFGADEELGGDAGNRKIAALLRARGIRLAWVDDEGGMVLEGLIPGIKPPVAVIGVAEKGSLDLKLTVRGPGGHSSMPARDTVIRRLAQAIVRVTDAPFAGGLDAIMRRELESLAPAAPFPERVLLSNLWLTAPVVERVMSQTPSGAAELHTTIAPTIIAGGVKENVLPPEAHAVINLRLHPRDTVASALAHVREAVGDPDVEISVLPGARAPSRVSDMDGASFRLLADTIRRTFPNVAIAPDLVIGGTDARNYEGLSDSVFRFIPLRVAPDELEGFHGTNERERVANLAEAVTFYERLLSTAK